MAYKTIDGKQVLEVAVVQQEPGEGGATEAKQEEQIVVAEEQKTVLEEIDSSVDALMFNGSILAGIDYDEAQMTPTSDTIRTWEYSKASVLVSTVVVTYTNSDRTEISSVVRTNA